MIQEQSQVEKSIRAAREALAGWSAQPVAERAAILTAFTDQVRRNRGALAEQICRETGKPYWESLTEVDSMINKVPLSLAAYQERRREIVESSGITRYKPHGVMAVLGPFNLPGHLPNGHIVPALLAGNTVVFKPSEYTPLVGETMAELWSAAGLPAGAMNLVQGGAETGIALSQHSGIDGLLFTGSVAVGTALHRAFASMPQKILALEMGGNNPLIVWDASDLAAAAYITIQSAYITAGQRCSCARRLIISAGPEGDRFLEQLVAMISRIRVGLWTDRPEPFMGPVISPRAAEKLLAVQEDLRQRGAVEIVPMRQLAPALLTPGLIDVTAVADLEDEEHFGPLLKVMRVANFDAAIHEANNTAFGLCASLLSDKRELYDRFYASIRAGIVNFNRPTTGASSRLPFGGVGLSGNHRPSGYFAADYCSYPVASIETPALVMPAERLPGIET